MIETEAETVADAIGFCTQFHRSWFGQCKHTISNEQHLKCVSGPPVFVFLASVSSAGHGAEVN